MSDLRAALVAIQELHEKRTVIAQFNFCGHCKFEWPCPTRRLADEALTARTTKNGDA